MNEYDDIIGLPRWDPQHHPRMPIANRASQFAPFAALSGHDEAISETARLTEALEEVDSLEAELLNRKVSLLISEVASHPQVTVTYFVRDAVKDGGSYTTHSGAVRRVEEAEGIIVFADGTEVSLQLVRDLTGPLFADIEGSL